MANVLNIIVNQGEDFKRTLTIKDQAGAPINLTGYSFRGQAREKYNAPTAAFTFSFSISNQTTNVGQVVWSLSNTALVSLPLTANKEYVYDVEMVNTSLEVTRILQGKATVTPEATK